MANKKQKVTPIGTKNWLIVIMLGMAGQIAWNVENSWFNTFVFDTITPDPKPIAWMVAISALTATVTTLIIGTVSDGIGKRKPFILYGYILWGLSTAIFPMTSFIRNLGLAIVMLIIADAVMTFFGSTAYDAAYNAWTTDISDETNRGLLSGVISIFPLLAAVIGTALSGFLIDQFGYYTFFYSLGLVVGLLGVVGGILLKDSPHLHSTPKEQGGFFKKLFTVFSPNSLKENRELFLVFTTIALFFTGYQVFSPYQMIYINNYLHITKSTAGVISGIAVVIAMLVAIPVGKLVDRGHLKEATITSLFLFFAGQMLFSFAQQIPLIIITVALQFVGLIVFLLSTGAWIKNLMPSESRGRFEGVRMIFNVAIPMVIGPSFGSYLITHYGLPAVLNGESGFIPTPVVFQAAAVICMSAFIPILIILSGKKRGTLHG